MARLPDPAVRRCWEERMLLFEQSDLSVVDFCEQEGVSTASFYLWRRKIGGEAKPRRQTVARDRADLADGFVPVTVEPVRECFRICFSDRAVVEIPVSASAALLQVVERLAAVDCDRELQP
ncbi:MAG: hypothetical protein RIK87_08360 [Fuerstiella sp.]